MPCCMWIDDREVDVRTKTLDKELLDLVNEANALPGSRYGVLTYERTTRHLGLFFKRTSLTYSVISLEYPGSWQILNFGPPTLDDSSIGHYCNRQTVAAYFYGVLNGFRAKEKIK